jgi:hypothetical protein
LGCCPCFPCAGPRAVRSTQLGRIRIPCELACPCTAVESASGQGRTREGKSGLFLSPWHIRRGSVSSHPEGLHCEGAFNRYLRLNSRGRRACRSPVRGQDMLRNDTPVEDESFISNYDGNSSAIGLMTRSKKKPFLEVRALGKSRHKGARLRKGPECGVGVPDQPLRKIQGTPATPKQPTAGMALRVRQLRQEPIANSSCWYFESLSH